MKKLISLVALLLLLSVLSGCTALLGGTNCRELGEFIPAYTDGTNAYFEYHLAFEDGMVMTNYKEEYTLVDISTADEAFKVKDNGARVVLESYITALSDGANCAKGYDFLYSVLDSEFDISSEDVFSESKILKNNSKIYGAVNLYSRPSGRSGSLLTYENISKGVIVDIVSGEVNILWEFDDAAVLAFNEVYCVIYRDKKVYSVNITSGEETLLFKDKWWDRGPSYYNDFKVSFTDISFVIYAQSDNGSESKETLMAGNLDGTGFTTLIDNKKIEY